MILFVEILSLVDDTLSHCVLESCCENLAILSPFDDGLSEKPEIQMKKEMQVIVLYVH